MTGLTSVSQHIYDRPYLRVSCHSESDESLVIGRSIGTGHVEWLVLENVLRDLTTRGQHSVMIPMNLDLTETGVSSVESRKDGLVCQDG